LFEVVRIGPSEYLEGVGRGQLRGDQDIHGCVVAALGLGQFCKVFKNLDSDVRQSTDRRGCRECTNDLGQSLGLLMHKPIDLIPSAWVAAPAAACEIGESIFTHHVASGDAAMARA
jgi:hypothetical protein